MHRDRNPDTPLPPEFPAGKNPPDGVIIDYFLAENPSAPVNLEILDASGQLVRKYSSTDKAKSLDAIAPKHPIPMYWVREDQILSAAAGMHRFLWNVRYTTPRSLSHNYPISAIPHDTPQEPQGAWALPGRYTVKLTVDGKSYTQPLQLKMDPRVKTSGADLAKQFSMQQSAVSGMNRTFETLAEIKSAREQIRAVTGEISSPETKQKLADFDQEAAALEGAAVPGFLGLPPSGKRPENFSTLNQHLGQILAIADAADAAPTAQTENAARELESALTGLSTRWKDMKSSKLPVLNQSLEKEKAGKIDPERRDGEAPEADEDGDDQP